MTIKTTLSLFAAILITTALLFMLSLYELYTQLARYKNYWNVQNAQVDTEKGQVYVAFGDSAAQGIGARKPEKGYVGIVAEHLSRTRGEKVQVLNLSKSGAKIQDVLNTQLPAYEKYSFAEKPAITVEIGANDMLSFNAQTFEKEMNELMTRLPKQTIISDIPYFGGTRFKKLESNVEQANKIMYRLAEVHGFRLAKLHDKVQGNASLLTMAPDVFHPSNKGYKENWSFVFIEQLSLN